jgi:hypothetical protein
MAISNERSLGSLGEIEEEEEEEEEEKISARGE